MMQAVVMLVNHRSTVYEFVRDAIGFKRCTRNDQQSVFFELLLECLTLYRQNCDHVMLKVLSMDARNVEDAKLDNGLLKSCQCIKSQMLCRSVSPPE
jgi:hypothetical protein